MKSYALIAYYASLAVAASTSAPAAVSIAVQSGLPVAPAANGGKITEVVVGSTDASGSVTPSFAPGSVKVKVGDTVRFLVAAGDISIIQTTLDAPCSALNGAAKSGPLSNPSGSVPQPSFDFVVKDTNAVFFTSTDKAACFAGNALAINPSIDAGYDTFLKKVQGVDSAVVQAKGIVTGSAVTQTAAGSTLSVSVASGTATAGAAGASASVATGSGTKGSGQSCGCQCLCGTNSFPQGDGVGMFGGFLGQMPSAPKSPQAAGASSAAKSTAAIIAPVMRRAAMPPMKRGPSHF